jgi:hypothetical protein
VGIVGSCSSVAMSKTLGRHPTIVYQFHKEQINYMYLLVFILYQFSQESHVRHS